MLSKLSIGLLALALLFGLTMPANAQGYWGMYGSGYGPAYHPSDTIPYYSPYNYLPYYTYLAYYTPYYPDTSQYYLPRVYTQNNTVVMPLAIPIRPPTANPAFQPSSDLPIPSCSTVELVPVAQVPAPNQDYPALIALKNGGIYSSWNYWTSEGKFHFINAHGDHIIVPPNFVDSFYPAHK